jgi:hypothetical protein
MARRCSGALNHAVIRLRFRRQSRTPDEARGHRRTGLCAAVSRWPAAPTIAGRRRDRDAVPVIPGTARHRGIGAVVLVAGSVSAVLAWLSLTMVELLDDELVLLMTFVSVLAGVVVAARVRGWDRRLALLGSLIALMPILVVAGYLLTSEG